MHDMHGTHAVTWSLVIVPATMFFVTASLIVAELGAGARSGVRFSGFLGTEMRDWPNPALPLASAVRVLMEALAGFGVMVAWYVPVAGALVFVGLSTGWNAPGTSFPGWLFERASVATLCVILPGALAWLLPARNRLIHVLRGAIVAILATAPIAIPIHSVPQVVVLASALVAGLLATARVAMIPGPFTRAWPSSGPSVKFRASRPPLAQFCRDGWLGPLRATAPAIIISVACLILTFALARAHIGPQMLVDVLGGATVVMVGTTLFLFPLGTGFRTTADRGAAGLFSGNMGLAWTSLPLRREWVMRAVYLHGFVVGLAFVALNLLGVKMTGGLAFFGPGLADDPIGWVLFLCAVPPLAGFMTCRAAGDKVRGAISLTSLVVIWLGAISFDLAKHVALVLAMVLAVAGGGPPLVHGFRRRTRVTDLPARNR